MQWLYKQPVAIYFGKDKRFILPELAKEKGFRRGVLVCDQALVKNGAVAELVKACDGLLSETFTDIKPNPTVKNVDDCARLLRETGADFVVALGGGSSMDCAKAAAAIALTKDSISVYHGTGVALPAKVLPVIQIPTTAGTGSEVTAVSVLTNEEKGFKAPIASDSLYAVAAIIDPVLTYSLPAKVAAITGLDVLAHAIEGYQSKNHQPICDLFCVEAAKLVFTNIRRACSTSVNPEAKAAMAEASLLAGLGFNLPKTGPSHACSFVLTNRYGIPHGEACALTLDYFLEIISQGDGGRMDRLAQAVGFSSPKAMAEEIRKLKVELGLRIDLKDLALDSGAIDKLVADSYHPNMLNSPVDITEPMLKSLYVEMC